MNFVMRVLIALAVAITGVGPLSAAEPAKTKLLVLVVFDQFRGDYPERWGELFGKDGFRRLQTEGAWFNNCHYPYATTQTGPGHASMLTGCSPNGHGICMNQWYDRKTSAPVNCAESDRYQRVPALPKMVDPEQPKDPAAKDDEPKEAEKTKVKHAGSPEWILAPTIGDVLKETSKGKAKVVGLSFKDRSALLPVGKSADAVYWLDSTDGQIVTSSFYRDSVHHWVAAFNRERIADRWFDKDWERFLPKLDYLKNAGPDQVTGEGRGVKQGVVFPHRMDGGLTKPGKSYYEALFNSPFGNEFLFDLVKKAVIAEKLGQDDITDLLVVSFSSNDAIGHIWGPDSQEVLDVTLRSDRLLAQLLAFLDKEVGKDKYTLALTADHGICPLPEVTAAKGGVAKRIPAKKMALAAEEHLRETFDKEPVDPASKAKWIESVQPPWFYLNHTLIENRKLKVEDVAAELAKFLAKQEGIDRALTRADLDDAKEGDPMLRRLRRSFHPDRCGDVGTIVTPFFLVDNYLTGTTHGSPHPYDTHVPLMILGPGVRKGTFKDAVTPQAITAIFAQAAGIPRPRLAEYPVPTGLFPAK